MPCGEPTMTQRDNRCFDTCELINTFVKRDFLAPEGIPEWITMRRYIYPMGHQLDEAVIILCNFCKGMGEDFIYNGRDRDCRHLADWWEDHQKSEGHEPIL